MHRDSSVLEVVITTSPGKTKYLAETVRSFTRQGIRPFVFVHTMRYFDAWNRCIERAKGKYLCLAHHDDVYQDGFCRETVAFLEAHPEAVGVSTLDYFTDERGRPTGSTPVALDPQKAVHTFGDVFRAIVKHRNVLRQETLVWRTDAIRNLRYREDYYPADDKDFQLLALSEAGPIGLIQIPLVWYRVHNASVSERIKRNPEWCTRWLGAVKHWGEKHPEAITDEIRNLYDALMRVRRDIEHQAAMA